MAENQEGQHGWVQIKIWKKPNDSDLTMEVEWSMSTNQALLLVVEEAEPHSASTPPKLFWIEKKKTEYDIDAGSYIFTAYGLIPAGPETHEIVSSEQATIKIKDSGKIKRKKVVLKDHTRDRSILKSCRFNGNPFPVAMDKSRSHLVFSAPARSSNYHSMLFCQQKNPFEERILLKGTSALELRSKTLEPILPSRKHLFLQVLILEEEDDDLFCFRASSTILETKTYLNKADLQKLMDRALDHRRDHEKVLLTHFFRDKPEAYFENIFNEKDGLMETYRKDANGDQDSAINNGNLFGLFFNAALFTTTKEPLHYSYFGDVRLLVAASILFCERSRLYFADFYCMFKAHYITLVLTKQGSEADQFCQKRLLELDPQKNPFLTRKPVSAAPASQASSQQSGSPSTHHSTAASSLPAKVYTTISRWLLIEVLYTENIHITALWEKFGDRNVSWDPCEWEHRKSSHPNGIPKNPSCKTCNLPQDDDASNRDDDASNSDDNASDSDDDASNSDDNASDSDHLSGQLENLHMAQ